MTERFTSWFYREWPRAGLVLACFLILLAPAIYQLGGLTLLLIYLQSPVYMLHQYEEHGHGAFKKFANDHLGGGKEVLSDAAIFFINIVLVWAVNLAVFYLALAVSPGLGLISIYLSVVNGVMHVLMLGKFRTSNPGLWTAVFLFLPLGIFSLFAFEVPAGGALPYHALGFIAAIAVHAGIIVFARRRIAALST